MTSILDDLRHDFMGHLDDAAVRATLTEFFGPVLDPLFHAASALLPNAPRRKVLLLPGILGSTLEDTGDDPERVWLKLGDRSILERLRLAPGNVPAEDVDAVAGVTVKPGTLLKETYLLLQIYLEHGAGFEAIPFPFDWRRSIEELADQLFDALPHGEFSIVGHSMGCLVTRCCAQRHPEMVERLEHAVFLAPPFKGSFVPLRVLAGEDWLNELFVVVSDVRPSEVLATFPGFMEMVPDEGTFAGTDALLDDPRWSSPTPSPQVITRARAFARRFRAPEAPERAADDALFAKASIVLASNRWTPDRVQRTGDEHPTFPGSVSGDDTVPAKSAWDDRACGHYEASFAHAFIPQELAVIHGTAELLRSRGQRSGALGQPLSSPTRDVFAGLGVDLANSVFARVSSLDALTMPVDDGVKRNTPRPEPVPLPAPGAQRPPRHLSTRLRARRLSNADLHWLFAGSHPPSSLAPVVATSPDHVEHVDLANRDALNAQLADGSTAPGAAGAPALALVQRRRVAERCLRALHEAGAASAGEPFRFALAPTFALAAGLHATPALAAFASSPRAPAASRPALPFWCAEVLDDITARDERRLKLPLYTQAGIDWIWLIDPQLELLEVYRNEHGRPLRVDCAQAADVVRLAPFALEIALASLWHEHGAPKR
jgi:pimeloyl-ACP methyl ester carboxylesterase